VGAATETEMKEKEGPRRGCPACHARGGGRRHRSGRRCGAAAGGRGAGWSEGGGDEKIGIDIIRRACEEPVRQIVGNAGYEGAIVIEKIRANKDPNFGFNAATASMKTW
jgi:chaperonin GroEL